MGWIVKDFKCNDCGNTWEELYKKGEEDSLECPSCASHNTEVDGISSPPLGKYSMADKAGQANMLRKRSADHTKKEVLKNADRFGDAGLQRRAEYLK